MTIYQTAYDTTIGNRAVLDKIVTNIQELNIRDTLYLQTDGLYSEEDLRVFSIYHKDEVYASIPYFTHPLLMSQKLGGREQKMLVNDVRSLITHKFTDHNQYSIRNKGEFDLLRARTVLNSIWLLREPSYLRDISSVPISMYSAWIADNIARRYALDPKDQMLMAIISAAFYLMLFEDRDEFTESEKLRIAPIVAKATKAPNNMVMEVLDQLPPLANIHDFCNACKEILENPRLQDFNAGILVTVLGNTWFGMNAKEIMPVAMEHPPTWIALCYLAFVERTYKKSGIGTIALRYMGNKGESDFVRAFVSIVQAYSKPTHLAG